MATIKKKLIHFEKLSDFQARLDNGDIQNISVVWIKDAKKIWTHGTYYNCDDPDLSNYLTAGEIANLYLGKADKAVSASNADVATKATHDANGNAITSTYATKTEVNAKYTKPDTGIPASDLADDYVTESELTNKGYTTNQGTVTSVVAGTGLNGGTITSSGTISLASSGVTAGSKGPTAAVTGNYNTSVAIPRITVDTYGRVTALSSYNFTTKGITGNGTVTNIVKVSSLPSSPDANTLYIIV